LPVFGPGGLLMALWHSPWRPLPSYNDSELQNSTRDGSATVVCDCGGRRGVSGAPPASHVWARWCAGTHVEVQVVAWVRAAVHKSPPQPVRAVKCTGRGRNYSMVQCGHAGDSLPPNWVWQHSTPRQTQRSSLQASQCVSGSQNIVLLVYVDVLGHCEWLCLTWVAMVGQRMGNWSWPRKLYIES
jgi:hypothetical protein